MRTTDEDIGLCVDLLSKATVGIQIDRKTLEKTLKAQNIITLLAKVEEKVVGMVSGLVFPSMIPPPRIEFLSVLDEESARKGLHSLLIDEFIEELKRRLPNAKFVDTNISVANSQLIIIYSLKGFVIAGFTKGEPPFVDAVVLRKNISKETSVDYAV